MQSLVIVNPAAGQHKPEELRQTLKRAFRGTGSTVVQTERAGHAEEIAREAAGSGKYDAICVCGGDGTINEVANGILSAPEQAIKPKVGLLPLGTCNVLANALRIPCSNRLKEACEVIRSAKTRPIDIGRAQGRYFLLMAGFGFDADAVRMVAEPVKSLVGAPAYIMSGLAALAQCKASRLHLTLDDDELTVDAFLVVVANVSSYAFEQFKVAPFASLDDGWLDICIFERPPMDRVGFAAQIALLLARRHLDDPRVRYYRARRVRIESDPPIAGQLDGDLFGKTPVEIEVAPKALEIFVP